MSGVFTAAESSFASANAVKAAITAGIDFLARHQLPTGEFTVMRSPSARMTAPAWPDPAIFPTAIIVRALGHCGGTQGLRSAGCRFLSHEVQRGDLWKHWPASHPAPVKLPPDVDDTACVSLALATAGQTTLHNQATLLGNRDGHGRFYTWILWRWDWRGEPHAAATWRQLLHLPGRFLFFRRTEAASTDVDAVVNANALAWLGDFDGSDAVAAFLHATLEAGDEAVCDKYYEDPLVVRYFLSLALAGRLPAAGRLIVERTRAATLVTALDYALAITTLAAWGEAISGDMAEALLAMQLASGSWPCAPVYCGGRTRRADRRCLPARSDMDRWGSEELTTGLCLEALGRVARAR